MTDYLYPATIVLLITSWAFIGVHVCKYLSERKEDKQTGELTIERKVVRR